MMVLLPVIKLLMELVGIKNDVIIMVDHSVLTSIGLLLGEFETALCTNYCARHCQTQKGCKR